MTLKKHHLNTDFVWQDAEAPFQLISEQQASQWNEHGYFLLQGVLPPELISDVTDAIDPLEAKTNA